MVQLIKLPLCDFFVKCIYWMLHDDAPLYTAQEKWLVTSWGTTILTHHELECFRGVFSQLFHCGQVSNWVIIAETSISVSLVSHLLPFIVPQDMMCHWYNSYTSNVLCNWNTQIIVYKLITSSRTSKYRLLYHHIEAKIITALHGCILINNRSFYDTHIYIIYVHRNL